MLGKSITDFLVFLWLSCLFFTDPILTRLCARLRNFSFSHKVFLASVSAKKTKLEMNVKECETETLLCYILTYFWVLHSQETCEENWDHFPLHDFILCDFLIRSLIEIWKQLNFYNKQLQAFLLLVYSRTSSTRAQQSLVVLVYL